MTTIYTKAASHIIRQSGLEPIQRMDESFVYIKGTNFGVAWDKTGYCEVITNYTKDGSWQALQSNPVCGTLHDCTNAAIRKAQYWAKKRAS